MALLKSVIISAVVGFSSLAFGAYEDGRNMGSHMNGKACTQRPDTRLNNGLREAELRAKRANQALPQSDGRDRTH